MADPIKTAKRIFDKFLSKADPIAMPDYQQDTVDLQAQAASAKGSRQGGFARTPAP
jgi:hypothetical protein